MAMNMADFEIDEEGDFSDSQEPEPYLFEPEFTEDELRALEIERQEEEVAIAQQPEDVRMRANMNWWCECGGICQSMPTEIECLCCREWDMFLPLMTRLNTSDQDERARSCVTSTEDFTALIHSAVLDFFFRCDKVNWKKRPTPNGPNGQLSTE